MKLSKKMRQIRAEIIEMTNTYLRQSGLSAGEVRELRSRVYRKKALAKKSLSSLGHSPEVKLH